jgi:dihydrodipicolinate synthase/N-acetylneuraminate lyase
MPPKEVLAALRSGLVIPAHPLALTSDRKLDDRHQRALTRYYLAAGVGGVAVGVHTTQFAIRDPGVDLYQPVLELAAQTVAEYERADGRTIVRVAGICGRTKQAVSEAETAIGLGYHAGLLSLTALQDASDDELITHCRSVADVIPLFGFYLQPAVGGRLLSISFWRRFAEIPNVAAIKIATFNRYHTLDVIRAVAESGRASDIALYTGNDDSIVSDLVTPFRIVVKGKPTHLRMVGGLLGHWAVWTLRAVELLGEIRSLMDSEAPAPQQLLTRGAEITDCDAALFDPHHGFAGCIPGIHEVLVRQELLQGRWCLNPEHDLSPGQMEEIDRVIASYPHLTDDEFVAEHLDEWLN